MRSKVLLSSLVLFAFVVCLSSRFAAAHQPPMDQWEGKDLDPMARGLNLPTVIYPGTKYCGPGNIADTYIPPDRYLEAEDNCCKAHDSCANYIPAGQKDSVSGLTNNCALSQSDCACEDALFKCLKSIGSRHANIIGGIYFSGMTRKCYTQSVPVKCKVGILIWQHLNPTTCRNCLNYCTDTTAPIAYHWRPTALFSTSNTAITQPPPC